VQPQIHWSEQCGLDSTAHDNTKAGWIKEFGKGEQQLHRLLPKGFTSAQVNS
jgi:hypothetical protein